MVDQEETVLKEMTTNMPRKDWIDSSTTTPP